MATLNIAPCLRARQLRKIPTGLSFILQDMVEIFLIYYEIMVGIWEITLIAKKLLSLEVYGYYNKEYDDADYAIDCWSLLRLEISNLHDRVR